jgi:NAD-dependent deacetylase
LRNIVILTGAGISAESGVPTFRGPDGLWEGHRIEDVATPQAYRHDPVLVQRFYDARRAALARVGPNAAHVALARLDRDWPGEILIVTQNVDNLHERGAAGLGASAIHPARLVHMHGELMSALCGRCGASQRWNGDLTGAPVCGCGGRLRPDIVWFGEMPYHMDRIDAAIAACDLFVSIGTSMRLASPGRGRSNSTSSRARGRACSTKPATDPPASSFPIGSTRSSRQILDGQNKVGGEQGAVSSSIPRIRLYHIGARSSGVDNVDATSKRNAVPLQPLFTSGAAVDRRAVAARWTSRVHRPIISRT